MIRTSVVRLGVWPVVLGLTGVLYPMPVLVLLAIAVPMVMVALAV
ncbi:MAG TPA: hypothetical protein VIY28_15885 [Pseudonocardiaceae bacterium]